MKKKDNVLVLGLLFVVLILLVSCEGQEFFVGMAAHASWTAPIGHTHPQKNRFVNNITSINTAIKNMGNIPSVMKKNIYSMMPAPFEAGLSGEFKIGSIFIRLLKPNRLIEKITSKIT